MIHRFKLIALILILLAIPLTVLLAGRVQNFINQASVGDRKLIMGFSVWNGGYSSQDDKLAAFKNSIEVIKNQTGRYPASFSIWVNFGQLGEDSPRNSFPSNEMLDYLDARNITPVIFLQPVGKETERGDGRFTFSEDSNPNPPSQQIRFNSSNPSAISKIYVSKTQNSTHPGNAERLFNSWVPGAKIEAFGALANGNAAYSNTNNFAFSVLGKVDKGTYWEVLVRVDEPGTLSGIFSEGKIVYLTMPPDAEAKKFSHAQIAQGSQDAFFRQFASAAQRYGKKVILRYAHEMNGNLSINDTWFPWSPGQANLKTSYGRYRYFNFGAANSPENYALAWRHIYDLVRGISPNVKFFWCPNSTNLSEIDRLKKFYPGNDKVDYVGFDVYEWDDNYTSMANLFRPNIRSLRSITSGSPDTLSEKPIIIGETGIVRSNPERKKWIEEGYPEIYNSFQDVSAILYFNIGGWEMNQQMYNALTSLGNDPRFQGDFTPAPTPTPTPTQTDPIVGVIRWDAWSPNLHPDTTTQKKWITANLNRWRYRLPFFTSNISSPQKDSELINEDSQEIIDQEILYTSQAGIDYFLFNWSDYWWQDNNPSWRYNYALKSYLNSRHKARINFSIMIGCCGSIDRYPSDWGPKVVPKIVDFVKDNKYQKVLNARPLIYVFGAANLRGWFNCGNVNFSDGTCSDRSFTKSKEALKLLRDKVQEAGLPNPYLVAMVWDPLNNIYTSATGYGFDAISAYSGHNTEISGLTQKTFLDLVNDNDAFREKAKSKDNKLIPPVNTGWDRRPDPDYQKVWYNPGTPEQVGRNLKAAIDWNSANPTISETNSVIIYAWNEFTEGGWLGPTLEDEGARLNAVADVLGGTHVTPIPTPTPTITVTPTPTTRPPSPTPTPTRTPTPTPTRVPTPTPTRVPTPTPTTRPPSPTPTPTRTPTPTPSISLTPTPTPPPGATIANLTIGIDGIGETPRIPRGGNKDPKNKNRTIEVKIYKAGDNSLVFSNNQVFSFNSSTNRFDTSISLPSSVETGIYNIYALGNPFLIARYPGSVTITKAQTTTLNSDSFNLITGDINRTTAPLNRLNILDYNVLVSCSVFSTGDARSVCNQNPDYLQSSDLDDDGIVNQDDITLLVIEMTNQSGESLP